MNSIYDRGAALVARLLAPEKYGQGQIVLSLTLTFPAENPWSPPTTETRSVIIRGAARGVDARMVGVEVGGTVLLASDRVVVCALPSSMDSTAEDFSFWEWYFAPYNTEYTAGDTLIIDGRPVHIISVSKIPAAGTAVALKFIVRG